MKQFRLPDPGEGLVEADIVTWRVKPGDEVKINDIVVEVETSKSLVELPIPFAGKVAELLVAEGDTVDVGSPIITIDDGTAPAPGDAAGGGAAAGDAAAKAVPEPEGEDAGEGSGRVAVLVGYGPRTTEAKRRPRKKAGTPAEPPPPGVAESFAIDHPVAHRADERWALPPNEAESSGAPLPGPGEPPAEPVITGGPVLAKPPVRKLAKDRGVDLTTLTGSGEGGIITRDDVLNAAATRAEPLEASATRAEPVEALPEPVEGLPEPVEGSRAAPARATTRIPIKGVRKVTAAAMVSSAFTAPHVSVWLTCDVTPTMEFVANLKQRKEFAEVKVSPLVVVAKAVCLALGRTPELNSSWDEPAQEIVLHGGVNLGIAAATPRGLVVPNVKNADQLGLVGLATKINELVGIARAGKIQPADTSGGTFSITNIGPLGVDGGTPILNPGEAGILAVGAIDRRPWVVGGGAASTGDGERVEPRWVTTLALSFDHRLADGEQGSRFLVDVATILRDPAMALLY